MVASSAGARDRTSAKLQDDGGGITGVGDQEDKELNPLQHDLCSVTDSAARRLCGDAQMSLSVACQQCVSVSECSLQAGSELCNWLLRTSCFPW